RDSTWQYGTTNRYCRHCTYYVGLVANKFSKWRYRKTIGVCVREIKLFSVKKIIVYQIDVETFGFVGRDISRLKKGIGFKSIDDGLSTTRLTIIISGSFIIGIQPEEKIGRKRFGMRVDACYRVLKFNI